MKHGQKNVKLYIMVFTVHLVLTLLDV